MIWCCCGHRLKPDPSRRAPAPALRRDRMNVELGGLMAELGRSAVAAAEVLATAEATLKNTMLRASAAAVRARSASILRANHQDWAAAQEAGLAAPLLDRILLDAPRVEAIARSLEAIAELPDPIGVIAKQWRRPNGLQIQRVSVPLVVIGIIYESRPNVTADAGGLCLKSGNAVILRGGSECRHSNGGIHACLVEGLRASGLPLHSIQLVPTSDLAAVGHMLAGMSEYLDVI